MLHLVGILFPHINRRCTVKITSNLDWPYYLSTQIYFTLTAQYIVLMLLHVSAILRELLNLTLRCVIPVVCVTNEREGSVVNQHN